jgi:hypothetical protein
VEKYGRKSKNCVGRRQVAEDSMILQIYRANNKEEDQQKFGRAFCGQPRH